MYRFFLLALLVCPPLWGVQCSVPDADESLGTFSENNGDADASAFDELDEDTGCSGADDNATTSWRSANNPNPDVMRISITSLTDPVGNSSHNLRLSYAKSASGGRTIDLTWGIRQGGTTISGCTDDTNTNISDTWVDDTLTISSGCADNITDYSDLSINVSCQFSGGGAGRRCLVSAMTIDVPDAPTPTGRTRFMFVGDD